MNPADHQGWVEAQREGRVMGSPEDQQEHLLAAAAAKDGPVDTLLEDWWTDEQPLTAGELEGLRERATLRLADPDYRRRLDRVDQLNAWSNA